ncbi:Dihydrofolate reductase [Pseudonocardia thermophila]|jgi:Dihydrofolate reductase|uniref:Dihydrofolate reductase n=1 Tax=Pseudonocardia thermophila TaxID=1848 RepID=A0A1M6RU87_PSETH|nr:dihydrofolate reductase family protein [Pseudonocardia thermophila]SHK36092.1 Dihydrofolate reductase [Pseudonocardia thermophila]
MTRVTCDLAVSLDGIVAGPNQRADAPFGDGLGADGHDMHRWMLDEAEEHAAELAAITEAGAYIMGRNMFGPGRGEWDLSWTGWWGPNPPYHAPVFVLTHYERAPLVMEGGTTFHFVTEGPQAALKLAREAAGERTVAIAGGASTVNQYLSIGAIDELRLHVVPLVVGQGERLFAGVGRVQLRLASARCTPSVNHLTYERV